ncbi:MAG: deaminase [Verrucomicrobia bacterium]|nr:deaminase [Verrucomicrobiota bacterium]
MRPRIFSREQIESAINIPSLIEGIERGFVLASEGQVTLAPISILSFLQPPGEVHIKSAHIAGEGRYVIKIASGFSENPRLGISSSQGLMLLFSAKTGQIETILLDEAYLTDIRTAIAGAISAKHFAPKQIDRIGIVGTGNQAAMQLQALRHVTDCKEVIVWGRNPDRLLKFQENPLLSEFNLKMTSDLSELCGTSSLIVTTTRSPTPLIFAKDLRPGVHVTAVGADQMGKQEIAADAMAKADRIYVDNLAQCLKYGDLSYAKEIVSLSKVQEIGAAIKSPMQRDPLAITIADLTGVAVQDAMIAGAIADQLEKRC